MTRRRSTDGACMRSHARYSSPSPPQRAQRANSLRLASAACSSAWTPASSAAYSHSLPSKSTRRTYHLALATSKLTNGAPQRLRSHRPRPRPARRPPSQHSHNPTMRLLRRRPRRSLHSRPARPALEPHHSRRSCHRRNGNASCRLGPNRRNLRRAIHSRSRSRLRVHGHAPLRVRERSKGYQGRVDGYLPALHHRRNHASILDKLRLPASHLRRRRLHRSLDHARLARGAALRLNVDVQ